MNNQGVLPVDMLQRNLAAEPFAMQHRIMLEIKDARVREQTERSNRELDIDSGYLR